MIEIKDIQTAVAKQLTSNGFTVTASEVKEGFSKPTCFVDVMPVSITLQNKFTELVTNSVEITYHPQMETKEEIILVSERLKKLFLYTPLEVCDRFLSVNEIVFDYDKTVLTAYFDIEFLQETDAVLSDMPKMKKLEERVVTESHGTSENIN